MDRFLITTADERTWKFDRPVLFLGEWCRLYGRRHVWERMDGIVAEPYGISIGQKRRDIAHTRALSRGLLPEVAEALNRFHGTTHGLRYWNIVVGHWLRRYVMALFNRYATVGKALDAHDVSGSIVFAGPYSLATVDSASFTVACNDTIWNHFLYARILEFLGLAAKELRDVELESDRFERPHVGTPRPVNWKIMALRYVRRDVLPRFARQRDAVIIGSYLPFADEAKLQLRLGQVPQLWSVAAPELAPAYGEAAFCIASDGHAGFERLVRQQLGSMIPSCFTTGYAQLVDNSRVAPFPARPKFIFTSNNFDTDEVFKVWVASKTEEGAPYFTGQHGNNYGTSLYAGDAHWPDRAESDRFFSWGWSDGSENLVPAFYLKTAAAASLKHDPRGGLLLIELCPDHRFTPWDAYFEFGVYQKTQFRFVERLPAAIREELVVRLHADSRHHQWSDVQRWKDNSPHVRVETGGTGLRDLIAGSRLTVHSYDGTSMLETLAANLPTLCFWNPDSELLLPQAKADYQQLRNGGILVDTAEQAAATIERNWSDIDGWWRSAPVQQARAAFCSRYARGEGRPVRTLERLLTNHAAQVRRGAAVISNNV